MKVMLLCQDIVGKSMAGPAIRYWELSKALSKKHEVILSVPNKELDITTDDFQIKLQNTPLRYALKGIDVVITQTISLTLVYWAKMYGIKLILDAYDPIPLENLEIHKDLPLTERNQNHNSSIESFLFSFRYADGIICANEKQRNLWMGFLLGLNRLNPTLYDQDPTLKHLIDIVPFGLSSTPPQTCGDGLRKIFNIKPTDKVILWGGGIWNWFDPLSVIKAVHQLSLERSDIHLVFMGLKHPNEHIPQMKMSYDAVNLAKSLGLFDKHVFFNFGWTPYEQRQNFLLESDIGISTHFDHLETQYAFRTRMLDYIWAKLPIVATEGDCFADLVKSTQAGIVVPYQSPEAIAKAVKDIVDDPGKTQQIKESLTQLQPQYYWEHLAQPLERMIYSLCGENKEKMSYWSKIKLASGLAQQSPKVFCEKVFLRLKRQFSS